MQAIENEGKRNTVYHLNKKFLSYEVRDIQIIKTCLALIWANKMLRHYMYNSKVNIVARVDPLKHLIS